jgi:hypothetical protein
MVVRGATRAGGDDGGAIAGEAGDAVNARGFDGFGKSHIRQNGGQAVRQHRLPRLRWAKDEEIMVITPT